MSAACYQLQHVHDAAAAAADAAAHNAAIDAG